MGNSEAFVYASVVLAGGWVVSWLAPKYGYPVALLWILSLWGIAHMAAGAIPRGDDRILYNACAFSDHRVCVDQGVHALGFGAATFASAVSLGVMAGTRKLGAGLAVMAFLAGMGIGALNEIAEFFSALWLDAENVGGFVNTGWDLVADALGAAVAVAIAMRVGVGRRDPLRD